MCPHILSYQGSETTIFPCECWLARSEDDGETVRELVPSDIITEKLLRDGTLKVNETEVEDALESMCHLLRSLTLLTHALLQKGSILSSLTKNFTAMV